MPWSSHEAKEHNKKATGAKGRQWSEVANSVLKKSGDEGKAVRIANAAIRRRRMKKNG